MVALAVTALHGLGAVPDAVAALAARANEGIRALIDPVTLLATVSATGRGGIGAVLAHVAFLVAMTALAIEDGGVGAIGLAVAIDIVSL